MKFLINWFTQFIDRWWEAREERKQQELEDLRCPTCKILEQQLFLANNEKDALLKQLLEITKPQVEVRVEEEREFKPLKRPLPWHVMRAELEKNDLETAKKMKAVQEANKELEKELGLETKEVNNG